MSRNNKFEHIISLGFFCSVAMEIERIKRRDASYPFDWCISEFTGVIDLINNNFDNFLKYEQLMQNSSYHSHYMNQYGIQFFHDFNEYQSLKEQLDNVTKKYNRRIKRFYKTIKTSTLFVRYVCDQQEINYILENYISILAAVKKYNPKNTIIFIVNNDIDSFGIKCYRVEKDDNDSVARYFLNKNEELKKEFLLIPEKKRGLKVYFNRILRILFRTKKKIRKKHIYNEEYIHYKQYI